MKEKDSGGVHWPEAQIRPELSAWAFSHKESEFF
jgi:hypothetical protein